MDRESIMLSVTAFFMLLVIGLNSGCEPAEMETVQTETVCNCQQRDKVAEFIQGSIKNANNMSDEEMEDVIRELRHTAINIYCPLKNVKALRSQGGHIIKLTEPLDSCEQLIEY